MRLVPSDLSVRETINRKGELLVEFALIALILYLLLAGIIEFGRALYAAQVLQQATDAAARELSRLPLPVTTTSSTGMTVPTTLTGPNGVLSTSPLAQQVYSENYLVVDLSTLPSGQNIQQYFASAPLLNQLLMPLMIYDPLPIGDNPSSPQYFRYPGQLVPSSTTSTGLTVVIPIVQYSGGADAIINTIPVVEEMSPSPTFNSFSPDPDFSPFNLLATFGGTVGQPGVLQPGVIALRINYPFQAATLAAYSTTQNADGSYSPITTTEGGAVGPYAGADGLGRLYALNQTVRPFRRVLSAQAVFRREMFE